MPILGAKGQPLEEITFELEPLIDDCDGDGTSMVQFSKAAFGFLTAYSRCGLWTDFPTTTKIATLAQPKLPVLGLSSPFKLLAWQRNEQNQLSSVLVEGSYDVPGLFTSANSILGSLTNICPTSDWWCRCVKFQNTARCLYTWYSAFTSAFWL